MSRTISPSSQQPYSVARVIAIWGDVARSTFYAARKREQQPREARKRGPKVLTDEELIAEIRQLLVNPIFTGEGYRTARVVSHTEETHNPDRASASVRRAPNPLCTPPGRSGSAPACGGKRMGSAYRRSSAAAWVTDRIRSHEPAAAHRSVYRAHRFRSGKRFSG